MAKLNLEGQRFGSLTVQSLAGNSNLRSWNCLCDCGNTCVVLQSDLRQGHTKSCGCLKGKCEPFLDMVGEKVGDWQVISPAMVTKNGIVSYYCLCTCGSERIVPRYRLTHGRSLSCGCKAKEKLLTNGSHMIGKKFGRLSVISLHERRKGKIYYKCACDCGAEKIVSADQLHKGETKSCGCLHAEFSRSRTRDKNPSYKHHLPEDYRDKHRLISRYKNAIIAAFERDNYTCRKCGVKGGGELNGHHIDGWNWCREKRLDVNNIVTLCKRCHDDFHASYGKGNNTSFQFNEWIGA